MGKNAKNLEFERLKRQKEQITFCQNFGKRQIFFSLFKTKNLVIREKSTEETNYQFKKGILTSHFLELNHSEDDRYTLDRANIVYKYIHSQKKHCDYYFK